MSSIDYELNATKLVIASKVLSKNEITLLIQDSVIRFGCIVHRDNISEYMRSVLNKIFQFGILWGGVNINFPFYFGLSNYHNEKRCFRIYIKTDSFSDTSNIDYETKELIETGIEIPFKVVHIQVDKQNLDDILQKEPSFMYDYVSLNVYDFKISENDILKLIDVFS